MSSAAGTAPEAAAKPESGEREKKKEVWGSGFGYLGFRDLGCSEFWLCEDFRLEVHGIMRRGFDMHEIARVLPYMEDGFSILRGHGF